MAELEEDYGAETARFQAFVQQRDDAPPSAWNMRASGGRIGLLALVVVVVAVVVALMAWLLV
ncbi:MAG TPA: hypothetical protein VH478_06770 [Trebonia sp.]|jgi:hypothetical protein|nr:hypothetical protein [Trebonia sp.]